MREIPAEVATLLKSRSMIGNNKPVTNLLIAKGQCTGTVKTGSTGYTLDLYMVLPSEKLMYQNVNGNVGAIFDISPVYFHQKIDFKIYRHDNSTFYYQSNPNHCRLTTIDAYTVRLGFEDWTDADFNDCVIEIYSPDGLIISGQEIMVGKSFTGIDIKNVGISRSKGMAASLNLTLDNKDGKYSPDKAGGWQNVFFPNTHIIIEQGYGSNLITTFNGLIDRIEMSTFPAELKLSVRDKLKLALDQVISGVNTHTLTYTNQTVEAIFTDLASKAGLTTGIIELTGITLVEKTFSWETYADCFQWLADLVSFEYGCDEEGLIYFRKETIPAEPTIAYTFREGEDIISLGYTIDDNDIYTKVVVYGKDVNDAVLFAQKEYVSKDYYNVLSQKFMKIDVSEASTVEQLQAIAEKAEMLMRSRVRMVNFAAIAIPWLQIGDIIQVIESSTTISELYRVTDLASSFDSNGYTMQITCYHHSL